MADADDNQRPRVADVVQRYGRCLELVTMDPNFQDISVGLYEKDSLATVWTFSRVPGVAERLAAIRDQLVALGGLDPVADAHNQARFPCGQVHDRPTRFLMKRAVEKPTDSEPPGATVKDLRSPLMLGFEVRQLDGRWVYTVTAEGEAPNVPARIRAVTGGFIRYGEMDKVGDGAAFPCGARHDELVCLILPYARNVTQAEDMLAADSLRGQMTTSTLGFTPPT